MTPVGATHGPLQFSPRPNSAAEIPWLEWGVEALENAASQGRPLLLSIAAAWCYRCHVMDETTYSDPAVADLIAQRYVPVRVDAEVRPDVAARYSDGELPVTAVLSSDGELIASANYLPPAPMLELLEAGQESAGASAEWEFDRPVNGDLWPDILDRVLDFIAQRHDAEHGGFAAPPGFAPKFVQAEVLRLLIYAHGRRGLTEALERVRAAIRAIDRGGVSDHVEGGVFHGSTARDWSAPYHHKLAVDQGALLLALGELALVDEESRDESRFVVERTIEYVERVLLDPRGCFRNSQDSDDAYYALPPDWRESRSGPRVDERIFTASNAALARGLLACGVAYDRPEWVERGRSAVDFLLAELRAGEAGMYRYWDGAPHMLGLLEDQVAAGLALLHVYEVTGASIYIEQATALARALERDWREPGGGFWDVAGSHERTGRLAERERPLGLNADAAEFMLWLGRLTHDERYMETARAALAEHAGSFERAGLGAASYARTVDRLLSAEPEIKVVGALTEAGEPDRASDQLHAAALRLPFAPRTVQRLDLERDAALLEQLDLPRGVSGVAYVFVGAARSVAIESPDDLDGAIHDLLGAPAL